MIFTCHDIQSVCLIKDETKDVDKHQTQQTDWKQLIQVESNGLEHIFEGLVLHEVEKNIKHE